MFWLAANLGIGLATSLWVYLSRRGEGQIKSWMVDFHLAFTIIGLLAYLFFGAGLLFWAYKYQYFMFRSEVRLRVVLGVALCWFLHDIPCWCVEFYFWWYHDWFHPLQTVSFAMSSITFLVGLVTVWLEYAWRASKYMDRRWGGDTSKPANHQVHAGSMPPRAVSPNANHPLLYR